MRGGPVAASPDAYVAALGGWQRSLVEALRAAVLSAGPVDEVIKWGHLVYLDHGPAILIRAEDERVLLGFWRGRSLVEHEPRIKAGGKYDMGNWVLRAGDAIDPETVADLARRALRMNRELGDPTKPGPA